MVDVGGGVGVVAPHALRFLGLRAGRMASRQNARPTPRSNGWAIGLVLLGLSATYIALTTPATPDGASTVRVILMAALGIWAVVQGMWFLTRGRAG